LYPGAIRKDVGILGRVWVRGARRTGKRARTSKRTRRKIEGMIDMICIFMIASTWWS